MASAFRWKIRLLDEACQVPVRVGFDDREAVDPLRGDVARPDQILGVERRQAGLVEGRQRLQRRHGIQVVGIHREKRGAACPALRGQDGVRRSERLGLDDEVQRDAGRRMLGVVPADVVVIGRDDERDVGDPGIGQRAEDVIEKGPAVDGDHRLAARVGGAPLLVIEARDGIRRAHPRAEAARKHHGSLGHV